ncbi:MAG: dioxygenase [Pseudomonadota bacterium]
MMCTPTRQEFILLSDTLGVSALVNILNSHPADATVPSLLGPFFRDNAPELPLGANIAPHDKGEVVVMTGRVQDSHGKPVANALLDVWQAGSDGLYDIQTDKPEVMDLRARFRTDKDGRYNFRTALPIGYGVPMDGPVGGMLTKGSRHGRRPAHIHFLLAAPGYQELATALYIAGDPHIESDAVFGVSGALIVAPQPAKDGPAQRAITYDFVMAAGARDGSSRVGSDPAAILAPDRQSGPRAVPLRERHPANTLGPAHILSHPALPLAQRGGGRGGGHAGAAAPPGRHASLVSPRRHGEHGEDQ